MWEYLTLSKDSVLGVLISTGTLASFAAFIYKKVSAWLSARTALKDKRAAIAHESEVLRAVVEVLDTLQHIERATKASRAMVLRAHNGGGPLSIADHMYTSIIHESFERKADSVREMWQRRPVDNQYAHLLNEIDKEGKARLVTSEMHESSDLRTVYEATDVGEAWVYKIGKTGKGMLYLSVTFKEEDNVSAADQMVISAGQAQLQHLFEQHEHIFHVDYANGS